MEYFFQCARCCVYKTGLKTSMVSHLKRKNKCKLDESAQNYTDDEINILSLTKKQEDDDFLLEKSEIEFPLKKSDIEIPLKKSDSNIEEEDEEEVEDDEVYCGICTESQLINFDENWDLSEIDDLNLAELIFSNNFYTSMLGYILLNDRNLNVIIIPNKKYSFLYKSDEDKYLPFPLEGLLLLVMLKLMRAITSVIHYFKEHFPKDIVD